MKKKTMVFLNGNVFLNMIWIVLAVIFLGSCSKKENARTETEAKTLKPFDVPFQPTGYTNILLVIAKEAGYYAEDGLDVRFNPLQGSSPELIAAVTTGKIKAATYGGTTASLTLIEAGNDLVIIGGIMSEGAALVTKPENLSQWKDFSDATLSGKKIAVTRAQSGDITFRRYLKNNGVDISKIEVVELDSPPTIIEAVKKGEVDAGIVYVLFRKVAENQGLSIITHIDELAPGYTCCRVVTTKKELEANRADFVNFLKGNIKAYRIFKTDPEKTLEYALKHYDVEQSVLKNEFYDYGHLGLSPDPAKKKILDFYEGMTLIGYAKGSVNVADYVDSTLYEEALAQVLKESPNDPVFLELKKEFDAFN
jgi:NitT/TauT family transport system substrate-binding protein